MGIKKVRRILFSKVPLALIIVLVRLIWFVAFFSKFARYSAWTHGALSVLAVVMYLFIISSDENPSYQIGWITVIAVMPLMGGVLYLLLGNSRPARPMKRGMERVFADIAPLLKNDDPPRPPPRLQGLSAYIDGMSSYPLYRNTRVDYYPTGEELFEAMMGDLEKARTSVYLEYFIVADGVMYRRLAGVLMEKARRGLDVRFLYDELGSIAVLPDDFHRELEEAGVLVTAFNPLHPLATLKMNHRDHRKLLIVDGRVGYTGGINIADEYINQIRRYGHWKDTGVRLEGEAVWSMTLMFLSVWRYYRRDDREPARPERIPDAEGVVQPYSDTPLDGEALAKNIYMDILWRAKEYVTIFNPYLVLDREMIKALTMAARKGVDVKIVVPAQNDARLVALLAESHYKTLIDGGVKVYRYEPGFIHAKSFLSDDEVAVVGTVNMDFRSLYLHYECGVLFTSPGAIRALKDDCLRTLEKSRPVARADVEKGILVDFFQAVLRVFGPLL